MHRQRRIFDTPTGRIVTDASEDITLHYPLVVEHYQRANFNFDPLKNRQREQAAAEHDRQSSTGSAADLAVLNRALHRSSCAAPSSRAATDDYEDKNRLFSLRRLFRKKLASDSALQHAQSTNGHSKDNNSEVCVSAASSSAGGNGKLLRQSVLHQFQRGRSSTKKLLLENTSNAHFLGEAGKSKSITSLTIKLGGECKRSVSFIGGNEDPLLSAHSDANSMTSKAFSHTDDPFAFLSPAKNDKNAESEPAGGEKCPPTLLRFNDWQKVLVVDNSSIQRAIICKALRRSEVCMKPLEAQDGSEALDVIARSRRELRRGPRSSSVEGDNNNIVNVIKSDQQQHEAANSSNAIVIEVIIVSYDTYFSSSSSSPSPAAPSAVSVVVSTEQQQNNGDGPRIARMLRDSGFTGLIIGAVANSGNDLLSVERMRQFRANGANTVMAAKPFNAAHFAAIVEKLRNMPKPSVASSSASFRGSTTATATSSSLLGPLSRPACARKLIKANSCICAADVGGGTTTGTSDGGTGTGAALTFPPKRKRRATIDHPNEVAVTPQAKLKDSSSSSPSCTAAAAAAAAVKPLNTGNVTGRFLRVGGRGRNIGDDDQSSPKRPRPESSSMRVIDLRSNDDSSLPPYAVVDVLRNNHDNSNNNDNNKNTNLGTTARGVGGVAAAAAMTIANIGGIRSPLAALVIPKPGEIPAFLQGALSPATGFLSDWSSRTTNWTMSKRTASSFSSSWTRRITPQGSWTRRGITPQGSWARRGITPQGRSSARGGFNNDCYPPLPLPEDVAEEGEASAGAAAVAVASAAMTAAVPVPEVVPDIRPPAATATAAAATAILSGGRVAPVTRAEENNDKHVETGCVGLFSMLRMSISALLFGPHKDRNRVRPTHHNHNHDHNYDNQG